MIRVYRFEPSDGLFRWELRQRFTANFGFYWLPIALVGQR